MALTIIPTYCGAHGDPLPCSGCRAELESLEGELHQFPPPEAPSVEESMARMALALEALVDVVSRLVT